MIDYRNWLKDYADRENLMIIDFYSPFWTAVKQGQSAQLFKDEFHPGIEGYELMGKIATRSLGAILKREL
jgi:lysophospholipase L1-like esterase